MKKYVGQLYRVIDNEVNDFKIGEIVVLRKVHEDKISYYKSLDGRIGECLYDADYVSSCYDSQPEVELIERQLDKKVVNNIKYELETIYADLSKCKRNLQDSHLTKNEAVACMETILKDMAVLNEKVNKL